MGPLHSDLEYTVSAQKEGFVLSAVEGTVGDFKAFALAGVTFEVTFFVPWAASSSCESSFGPGVASPSGRTTYFACRGSQQSCTP